MKKLIFLLVLVFSCCLFSCSKNTMVKKFGGKAKLELQPGEKLVNITWKDSELWILTREMTAKDSAITYNFREKSRLGIIEGNFTIVEMK